MSTKLEDIDIYFAPLDITGWDKEAREIMRQKMLLETGKVSKKKIKSVRDTDDKLLTREPMSEELKRIWWRINNHGTPEWCKKVGRTIEEHIKICNDQYTKRKYNPSKKALYSGIKITEETENLLPVEIKI